MGQKLCAYLLLFPTGSACKPEDPLNDSDLQSAHCRGSVWCLSDLLCASWCLTLLEMLVAKRCHIKQVSISRYPGATEQV